MEETQLEMGTFRATAEIFLEVMVLMILVETFPMAATFPVMMAVTFPTSATFLEMMAVTFPTTATSLVMMAVPSMMVDFSNS